MTHKENISTCPHCNNTGCDFCKKKENHLSKRELKIDNAIKAAITLMNSEKIKKRYPGGVSTMINMIRYALKSEFTPVLIHPSKSIFVMLKQKEHDLILRPIRLIYDLKMDENTKELIELKNLLEPKKLTPAKEQSPTTEQLPKLYELINQLHIKAFDELIEFLSTTGAIETIEDKDIQYIGAMREDFFFKGKYFFANAATMTNSVAQILRMAKNNDLPVDIIIKKLTSAQILIKDIQDKQFLFNKKWTKNK